MAAKATKKMFDNLDRAEVRKLAIVGMKLAPAKAYTMDFKTLVSWVHARATEVPADEVNGDRDRDPRPFVEVDLDAVGNEAFRDGVMSYIAQLQDFVRGNRDSAPAWPPSDAGDAIKAKEVTPEEPKAEVAPKRKRGRPRKMDTVSKETPITKKPVPEAKAAAPKKEVAPIAKTKLKKTKLSTKKAEPAPEAVDTTVKEATTTPSVDVVGLMAAIESLSARVEELTTTVNNISAYTNGLAEGVKDGFTTVSDQVAAVRTEQTAANNLLGNALLFLMNSVVFEEGEEKVDLAGVPEPNSYLDLD